MIPQETIEQVRQATDIVQLIGEYLRLKKRGKNYLALCPFHTEKTPSFNVSPDKQIFHCFGCGIGGNVFSFLIEHEKMSFVEAVRHLANRANITIREEAVSDFQRERLEKISYANQLAVDFYHKQLHANRYRSVLEDYLKGRRQTTPEAIDYFKLGLAGTEWDSFIKHAATKGFKPDELVAAGLALQSEKKKNYFDRFRHRLMIPIFNLSQKPIAFGGRTLKKGEPAKYMNSPETPLYNKGNVLYGLNFAKKAIRESNHVYVVEGYFDLISLWQVGIPNVVASSGTAFTSQQARLLARFADEVYLFFDADSAGRNAALKSVDLLYDAGLEVKVIEPPEGDDPDSIAGKEKLIKELSRIGGKIADPTRRSLFFDEAANLLGVSAGLFREGTAGSAELTTTTASSKKYDPTETAFLSLLFNNPGAIDVIFEKVSADDLDSKELARLYSAMIIQYRASGVVDAQALIDNRADPAFVSLVTQIASMEWQPTQIDSEADQLTRQILERKKKRIRAQLLKKLAEAEKAGDKEKAEQIIQEMKSYGL
jgi:DNA primase catalytic core